MILFDEAMKQRFGGKVYRLSLSSGCTCPNRDGKIGTGGCIFCSEGGSGDFASSAALPIPQQIEEAKQRVASKLSGNFAGYIAYFQSFTNTYGDPEILRGKFTEAILRPEILALSVATRPDCLPEEMVEMLRDLRRIKPVWVELGLQTIHEDTAARIHRGYPLSVYEDAVTRLKAAGLEVITHIIIGLPGENDDRVRDTLRYVCSGPIDGIKLQLLHVLKDTRLAQMFAENPDCIHHYTLEEYAGLIAELARMIPDNITVHRLTGDAPKKLLIAPLWSADKKRVLNTIRHELSRSQQQ